MKHRDMRSYLDLLQRIVQQAGNTGRSMAFRLTGTGVRERSSPWFQIGSALAGALSSGTLSGGTEKEFQNLVNQLRSHPLGARVLGQAAALSVQGVETHVGSLRSAKQRDRTEGSASKPRPRHNRPSGAEIQRHAGAPGSALDGTGRHYQRGQIFEVPSNLFTLRSRDTSAPQHLVLIDGPEVIAFVDLRWDARGRRRALEDLKHSRALTKRHLRDQARLYRLWASECRITRDEISTLLVCLHPANTPLSELIEYQRQLDAASFWAREFGRLATECETAARKLHAQPLAA